jgi:YbaB/EbfC DNA-binding family
MDPEQWLVQYNERIAEIAARARTADARLREVGGTATSPRGDVAVRVSAGGALEDLTLTPAARALEADELARLILDTTKKARHEVSTQIAAITSAYFGPAQEEIRKHLPADVPVYDSPDDDHYFAHPPEITR